MKIVLSNCKDIPIYLQIVQEIKRDILNGELKSDESLPSIRQLALDLKISVITVKNAYDELEKDGFIYALPSKGFFVSSFSESQIKKIRETIAKNVIENQINYLKSIGLDKEDILKIINEKKN